MQDEFKDTIEEPLDVFLPNGRVDVVVGPPPRGDDATVDPSPGGDDATVDPPPQGNITADQPQCNVADEITPVSTARPKKIVSRFFSLYNLIINFFI